MAGETRSNTQRARNVRHEVSGLSRKGSNAARTTARKISFSALQYSSVFFDPRWRVRVRESGQYVTNNYRHVPPLWNQIICL